MPKGFFTQSAAILLQRPVSLDAAAAALGGFTIARRTEAGGEVSWMGGQPSLLVAMRPDVNGYVLVQSLDRPWPDAMGDPKSDPDLFGAWATSWFGPFVFPGNLQRALQQNRGAWPEAAGVVARHAGFLRILTSYVLGGPRPDAPETPPDYDALAELQFVTAVARSLLGLPESLCYFNPNGETLHTREGLEKSVSYHREHNLPPLDVWTNVRLFRPAGPAGWLVMDTVGMLQLDVKDQEACFPRGERDPSEVANFLRNATDFVRENGPIVNDGNTMDGAGIRWEARALEKALVPPPRPILRWLPQHGPVPPHQFLGDTG